MKYVIWISLLVLFVNCSEDNVSEGITLEGDWVEVINRTDTLTFELLGDKPVMTLGRGVEIKNGNVLPKPNVGPYDYEVVNDKISLRWYLSSNSAFKEYYFDQTEDTIQVGNFYDDNAVGVISVFKRID